MRYAFKPGIPSWANEFDAWVEQKLTAFDPDALMHFRERVPAASTALPTWEHYGPVSASVSATTFATNRPFCL